MKTRNKFILGVGATAGLLTIGLAGVAPAAFAGPVQTCASQLTLHKVDSVTGAPLAGAVFNFDAGTALDPHFIDGLPTDAEVDTAIAGGEHIPMAPDGASTTSVTTDDAGLAAVTLRYHCLMDDAQPLSISVQEVTAPTGYTLAAEPTTVVLEVTKSGLPNPISTTVSGAGATLLSENPQRFPGMSGATADPGVYGISTVDIELPNTAVEVPETPADVPETPVETPAAPEAPTPAAPAPQPQPAPAPVPAQPSVRTPVVSG